MQDDTKIRVSGLTEFRKQLRELDGKLPKALRHAFNAAATNTVEGARHKVPKRTGAAQGSLRARSTQSQAKAMGGFESKVRYYGWLDFGGTVRHKDGSHPVERHYFKNGRYLYQEYFRRRDSGEFERDLQRELVKVAREAGLEVR